MKRYLALLVVAGITGMTLGDDAPDKGKPKVTTLSATDIAEGEYEWAIDDQPVKKLKVGDTFYEPTMCLHRVSKNPSDKTKTRVLAVLLVPRDTKELSIPEKPAKKE